MAALSGVFVAGYRSWQKQKGELDLSVLRKQRSSRQCQLESARRLKSGRRLRRVIRIRKTPKWENELAGAASGLGLAVIGFFYPIVGPFCVPFLLAASQDNIIKAWRLAVRGRISTETLVAGSILGVLFLHRFVFASLLSLLYKGSKYLTSKVIRDSRRELVEIFQCCPEQVWVLVDDVEIQRPIHALGQGDLLVVHAGEVIAADGVIVSGSASIDQQIVTGEALPVERGVGEDVLAMTLLVSGLVHVRVQKAGAESAVAKIGDILNRTAEYKACAALQAESFSRLLVNPTLIASAVAYCLFGVFGAVAVLLVHPKNRLSFVAPISLLKYLRRSARDGILVKDGRSLELLGKVNTIVFDKTGTLTDGRCRLGEIILFGDWSEQEIIGFAAVAEMRQKHPIALAVLDEARRRHIAPKLPEDGTLVVGFGMSVRADGRDVLVGSYRFMQDSGISLESQAELEFHRHRDKGASLVFIAIDGRLAGAIEVLPIVRKEANEVVQSLARLENIRSVCILSGDGENPTRQLANGLRVDRYFAECLPEQKAKIIRQLQDEGGFICYIGDGINDSIALRQAQVSISLSGASQAATDTAQIVLLNRGLRHLPRAFQLSTSFNRHMEFQLAGVVLAGILGASGVFLAGWGVRAVMGLNMASLVAALGFSFVDGPTRQVARRRVQEGLVEADENNPSVLR